LALPGGRYVLEEAIGAGGRAEAWLATDQSDGGRVVVKVPLPRFEGNREAARMFRREALSGARVHHPAIAKTLDYREIDGAAFLVLAHAPGRTISAWLRESGPMPVSEVLAALAQIAHGLHAVHLAGLVHRDVAPGNILWDGRRASLLDFGIAIGLAEPSLTADIEVPGNPEFLAPELVLGRVATPLADVYALGLVFLHAVTGERPFLRGAPEETATAHVLGESPRAPAELPSDLRILIHKMIEKDPDRRPSSALVVARLFDSYARSTIRPRPRGRHTVDPLGGYG
jgi:serine/threonine-protein kinase